MYVAPNISSTTIAHSSKNAHQFTRTEQKVPDNIEIHSSADGSRYKLQGLGAAEGGPRPEYIAYVFVFLGSITFIPFTPRPSHRFLAGRSLLVEGGERKYFLTGARTHSWRPWLTDDFKVLSSLY